MSAERIRVWATARLCKNRRMTTPKSSEEFLRNTIAEVLTRHLREPYWKDRENS